MRERGGIDEVQHLFVRVFGCHGCGFGFFALEVFVGVADEQKGEDGGGGCYEYGCFVSSLSLFFFSNKRMFV